MLLGVALVPCPATARADSAAASAGAGNAATASPAAAPRPAASSVAEGLVWHPEWQRFRWWEYAGTAGAMALGFGIRFLGPSPPHEENAWQFEKDIAGALAIRGGASSAIGTLGDIGYIGTIAYRFVDSALIPSIYWKRPDIAWQMLMIDLESFSIVATVVWTAQAFVGRQRPRFRDCPEEARPGTSCSSFGDNRYRSFIMGHFSVAATGAGLTCLHHARLGTYGGGSADAIACGAHVTFALATAFSRVAGEEHYVSDALLAGGLGFLAGYVVPSALHYGFGGGFGGASDAEGTRRQHSDRAADMRPAFRVTLLPFMQGSSFGISALGLF
jgi:hypothetical protein